MNKYIYHTKIVTVVMKRLKRDNFKYITGYDLPSDITSQVCRNLSLGDLYIARHINKHWKVMTSTQKQRFKFFSSCHPVESEKNNLSKTVSTNYVLDQSITRKENNLFVLDSEMKHYFEYHASIGNSTLFEWMSKRKSHFFPNTLGNVQAAAACSGWVELVEMLCKIRKASYREILIGAAKGGKIDIVKEILRLGLIKNLNQAAAAACYSGQSSIVYLLVDHGAKRFRYFLPEAASSGNVELMEYILNKISGNDDNKKRACSIAMSRAASRGHLKALRAAFKWGGGKRAQNQLDTVLFEASKSGNLDIINQLLKWGAKNFQCVLSGSVSSGHIEVAKLAIDNGALVTFSIIENAVKFGHIDLVSYLAEQKIVGFSLLSSKKYKSNLDLIMDYSAQYGMVDIVDMCKNLGVCDFKTAALSALKSGHINIYKKLVSWGAVLEDKKVIMTAAIMEENKNFVLEMSKSKNILLEDVLIESFGYLNFNNEGISVIENLIKWGSTYSNALKECPPLLLHNLETSINNLV